MEYVLLWKGLKFMKSNQKENAKMYLRRLHFLENLSKQQTKLSMQPERAWELEKISMFNDQTKQLKKVFPWPSVGRQKRFDHLRHKYQI